MEAELSKDSTPSTSAAAVNDNLSKETIDHSMNTTNNSSSNSSTKRRKRARKKKKKTSSLNKDFIEIDRLIKINTLDIIRLRIKKLKDMNVMERYDINIDVRVLPHDIAIINPFDTKK